MNPSMFGIPDGYRGLANPMEKDIFLEIDKMGGVVMPTEGVVKAATKFAEKGIQLHIDDGYLGGGEVTLRIDRGGMGGGDTDGDGYTGDEGGGGSIPYTEYLYVGGDATHVDFYELKSSYFEDDIRGDVFHYCIFCDNGYDNVDEIGDTDFEGITRKPNDFIICDGHLGHWILEGDAYYPVDQAAGFMHELGHILGRSGHCSIKCSMSTDDYVGYCPDCWSKMKLD